VRGRVLLEARRTGGPLSVIRQNRVFFAQLRILKSLSARLTASQSRVKDPQEVPDSLEHQVRMRLEALGQDHFLFRSRKPLTAITDQSATTRENAIPDLAGQNQEQVRVSQTIALRSSR